jgi:arginine decarboxylase
MAKEVKEDLWTIEDSENLYRVLGDIHNLFGRVTEVHVYADGDEPDNYFVEKVIKGTTVIQQKVKEGLIRPKVGVHLLDQCSKAFHEYTYLGPTDAW